MHSCFDFVSFMNPTQTYFAEVYVRGMFVRAAKFQSMFEKLVIALHV